jgi:hypothetical protein
MEIGFDEDTLTLALSRRERGPDGEDKTREHNSGRQWETENTSALTLALSRRERGL